MKCAICSQPVERRPQNRFFPFCSARCQQVDLGRWLAEDYVISEPISKNPDNGGVHSNPSTDEEADDFAPTFH